MYLTEIGHLPGICGRESHYLVGHLVEITVGRHRKIVHDLTELPAPRHSEVILIGPFGAQRAIAETVIIQVVECRSAECRLVHASHKQHLLLPRLHAHRQTRRQPLYIFGSCPSLTLSVIYVPTTVPVAVSGPLRHRAVRAVSDV